MKADPTFQERFGINTPIRYEHDLIIEPKAEKSYERAWKKFLKESTFNGSKSRRDRFDAFLKRIEKLAHDPRPLGCEKISGQDRFRIRQGNYRIIYSIQDDELTIWVVKISHRRDVYRKLGKDKYYGNVHE